SACSEEGSRAPAPGSESADGGAVAPANDTGARRVLIDGFDGLGGASWVTRSLGHIALEDDHVYLSVDARTRSGDIEAGLAIFRVPISGGKPELVLRDGSPSRAFGFHGGLLVYQDGGRFLLFDRTTSTIVPLIDEGQ